MGILQVAGGLSQQFGSAVRFKMQYSTVKEFVICTTNPADFKRYVECAARPDLDQACRFNVNIFRSNRLRNQAK